MWLINDFVCRCLSDTNTYGNWSINNFEWPRTVAQLWFRVSLNWERRMTPQAKTSSNIPCPKSSYVAVSNPNMNHFLNEVTSTWLASWHRHEYLNSTYSSQHLPDEPVNVYDVSIVHSSLLHGLQSFFGAHAETQNVQVQHSFKFFCWSTWKTQSTSVKEFWRHYVLITSCLPKSNQSKTNDDENVNPGLGQKLFWKWNVFWRVMPYSPVTSENIRLWEPPLALLPEVFAPPTI
jgi:hypothetical protein